MRSARVVRSGQGLSCFKWPSDSVAVVPTSIVKLSFSADQVTLEKVGVEVKGLAVYRIAEPLLAFRMIDLDRTSLTDVLTDMFVGATRRIVAGLTLSECLTHRKDRVAAALMDEIAPILAGHGASSDTNAAGWGVVLDTIEIQDVRVLSEEVFSRMQAPYREKLALDALRAQTEVAEERARIEAARRKAEEQAKRALMAEEEVRMAAERKRAEDAQRHADSVLRDKQEAELLRTMRKAEIDRARGVIELEARRASSQADADIIRQLRESHVDLTEARLREIMITKTMPEVAKAFRDSFGRVNVTTSQPGDLLGFLTAGIDQVLALKDAK